MVAARRQDIMTLAEPIFEGWVDEGPEPGSYVSEFAPMIAEELKGCSKYGYDVLVMLRVRGMTHRELADKLGLKQTSIEKYIVVALQVSRDLLLADQSG